MGLGIRSGALLGLWTALGLGLGFEDRGVASGMGFGQLRGLETWA